MADNLRKIEAGEKLKIIPRETYNAFVESALDARARKHDRGQGTSSTERQTSIVLVKNASGAARARFDILGIGDPIILPGDNEPEFKQHVTFIGNVPDDELHYGRFVVLLEPLDIDAIGRAYIAGACPVRLEVIDNEHQYADIKDDDATQLATCQVGSAHILWHDGSGWAVVRLGNPAPRIYALEDCDGKHPTLFVVNNLSHLLGGGVVQIEEAPDICFKVRVACDADHCYSPICVTIKQEYRECETCNACWLLTKCDDSYSFVTNTNLAEWEHGGVLLSDADTENNEGCYRVELADDCYDARPVSPIAYYKESDFCEEKCNKCYTLVRCHGPSEETLEVADDLAGLIDKTPAEVVAQQSVFFIQEKCWQVHSFGDCVSAPTHYGVKKEDYYPGGCTSCSDEHCVALVECDNEENKRCVSSATLEDGGDDINLVDRIGETCLLTDGKFYDILAKEAVDPNCVCEPGEAVVVREIFDNCESTQSWQLVNCDDEENTIEAFNDFEGDDFKINDWVLLDAPDAGCWRLNLRVAYNHGTTQRVKVLGGPYGSCPACKKEIKYRLTHDCSLEECGGEGGELPDIITTEDLHASVGKWRNVEGHAYKVAVTETGDVTDETLVSTGPYDSCEAALAAPPNGKVPPIVGHRVEGSNFILEMNVAVWRGGSIVGYCVEDYVIPGTICGGSSSS